MSYFFSVFFPGFAATILGVLLGFPVALYVNYRMDRVRKRQELVFELRRRRELVKALVSSLEYNCKVLIRVSELCRTGEVMFDPDLQLTTWDVIGHAFCEVCNDPDLLCLASHHWLRLKNLTLLNREMFLRSTEVVPEFQSQEMMLLMWKNFLDVTLSLCDHSKEIISLLNKYEAEKSLVS